MTKLKETYGIVKIGETLHKNKKSKINMEAMYNAVDFADRTSEENIRNIESKFCRGRYKILIVDDDVDTASTHFSFVHKCCGFEYVKVANDGLEALKILQHERFDLVLSDYRMPNMDGEKLYQRIQTMRHKPEFMIISGCSSDSEVRNLKEAGILVLPKPLTCEKLKLVIMTYYLKKLDQWRV